MLTCQIKNCKYIENQEAKVVFSKYRDNDRIAIVLVSMNGEPLCKATVNVPTVDIKDGEVVIKDYSENQGILQCLIQSGIVSMPVDFIVSDYVKMPICKVITHEQDC